MRGQAANTDTLSRLTFVEVGAPAPP